MAGASITREAARDAAHHHAHEGGKAVARHTPIPFVSATETRLRFDIDPRHHISFFADRLRLSPYTDLGYLFVGIGADVDELHPCFSPVGRSTAMRVNRSPRLYSLGYGDRRSPLPCTVTR